MCTDSSNYTVYLTEITQEDVAALLEIRDAINKEYEEDDLCENAVTYDEDSSLDKKDNTFLISDENTSFEEVAAKVIMRFLKARRPGQVAGFEVEYSCSRNRPGHIGGSAWYITENDAEMSSTAAWLSEKLANKPMAHWDFWSE